MFRPWTGHCQRYGAKTNAHMMSMFNTQEICMGCKDTEEKHPDYQKAQDAEYAACVDGRSDFFGIGLPAGLDASFHEQG